MRDISCRESQVDQLVTGTQNAREARQRESTAEMASREQAGVSFARAAEHMHAQLVLPRVEALVHRLPQAVVSHVTTVEGVHVRCAFPAATGSLPPYRTGYAVRAIADLPAGSYRASATR